MALVGLLIAFTITPQYTSTIKILVEPDAPKVVSLDPLQGASNIWYFYETQYEISASRSVAAAGVDNLKLEQHPFFIKAMSELKEVESSGSGSGTWKSLISDSDPKVKNSKKENRRKRKIIKKY